MPASRRLGRLAVALGLLALGHVDTVGATAAGPTMPNDATTSEFSIPIRHIVVIFQENHSFDNVLGRLCDQIAEGVVSGHQPCNGASEGRVSTGELIPLASSPDISPNTAHTVRGQRLAIDGGKMDGFDRVGGCGAATGYACYSQYHPFSGPCGATGGRSCIPNLVALARKFVISDRTFEFATTPSWAGHMVLGSSTLDGFRGDNPERSRYSSQTGPGFGCDSYRDTRWWNGSSFVLQPSCVPNRAGEGPYRTSQVRFVPTIFDRLRAADRSWRIYGGKGSDDGGPGWQWTICPTFYRCLGTSERNHLVDASNVLDDARAGHLPNFAIVTPTERRSQHNGYSMSIGDNWIGRIVSSIEDGPDWTSTAIFITYDDCGCFFDHVPPPRDRWGIRVPMVIVSPYAKAGHTDTQDATYASILAYTEHVLGLVPLRDSDRRAYDYSHSFDYDQAPLAGVPMTHTPVPRAERRYIAEHAVPGDVT